jgi:8-oxo-dGTP pyrophosphatase MutT (NUDIX family)
MEAIGLSMPQAVSVVIYENSSGDRVLAVRRPDEAGESFAGMWGLPAATVGEDETPEEAVRRLGRQKLGMTLEVGDEIIRESEESDGDRLKMVLFEAKAEEAEPKLVREWDPKDVTYYTAWKWAEASVFEPTAEAGSLCCRLFLEKAPGDKES